MQYKINTTVAKNGRLRNEQLLIEAKDKDEALKLAAKQLTDIHGKAWEINSSAPFGQQ